MLRTWISPKSTPKAVPKTVPKTIPKSAPMAAPLKTVEGSDIAGLMHDIGRRAKAAARVLALAPTAQKDQALAAMAERIRAARSDILAANALDIAEAKASGATAAFLDRLALDEKRVAAMADGLELVPTRDRVAVGLMLQGLDGNIDVIVPRGGKSLVARVQAEARVPVFAHLEGICHVYVDKAADLAMAKAILLNAKMRRTGVCGAAETLLVDRAVAPTHLAPLVTMLLDAGCEVRGDEATRAVDQRVRP